MAEIEKIGDSGSPGITLPEDKIDELGLEAGDKVVIVPTNDPGVLTVYFPEKQTE